jgi:hypothetical protein
MGRSCCGSTPPQADAIDKAEVKRPDTSSVDCNGGTSSEISGQENSRENSAVQNNDNSNTTSSAKIADPWCEEPTETSKGKAPPGACEGGCCGDQSAEAVGIKNVPSLGSSASKEACCAENPNTKAGILNCSVSSSYTPTHASSGTPRPSETATSAKPIVAECCEGKSSPCCNETCLDRLALRECDTGSNIPCMEAAGHCMLNGKILLSYCSTNFDTMQLFLRRPDRKRQRSSAELATVIIARLESNILLSLQHSDVSAVLLLPLAKTHAVSLERPLRWRRGGALKES